MFYNLEYIANPQFTGGLGINRDEMKVQYYTVGNNQKSGVRLSSIVPPELRWGMFSTKDFQITRSLIRKSSISYKSLYFPSSMKFSKQNYTIVARGHNSH